MSSKISIDNINIKNHQSNFLDPIELQITFSNSCALEHAIEWKIIYFGSANVQDCDQVLEQFQIPAVEQVQTMKFELSCPPPDFKKLPRDQLLCVTALILTVSYKGEQFIRVGYYVHYQYVGCILPELLSSYPASQLVKDTKRTILYDKPRVTKFNIKWQQSSKSQQNTPNSQKMSDSEDKHIIEEKLTLEEKIDHSNGFQNSKDNQLRCQ